MQLDETYLRAVASRTEQQLRGDLASLGFSSVMVSVSVGDDDFVVEMTRPDGRRVWRHPVGETVYHYCPDGRAADRHALWLSTLVEEENTDIVHRP